jgi:hypothetical protein
LFRMVLLDRIELSTSPLPRECSTTELQQRPLRWRVYAIAILDAQGQSTSLVELKSAVFGGCSGRRIVLKHGLK